MDNEARILLDDVIEFCRRDGREMRLINMLEQCGASNFDGDSLTIQVPSRFAYTYLIKQREVVEGYLEEISFMPMRLEVCVEERPGAMQGDGAAGSSYSFEGGTHQHSPSGSAGRMPPLPASEGRAPSSAACDPQPIERPEGLYAEPTPAQTAEGRRKAGGARVETTTGTTCNGQTCGVSVVNTISPDKYKRMMEEMRAGEAPGRQTAGPPSRERTPMKGARQGAGIGEAGAAPAVDINAKYTFESFVAGDENRHAFSSAMRFAAYAEEPGQCPSLFIYGNSGLGKTHLLFAVRNYLAKEKPYIRVKYANSQAYLDDYMNELGAQRGPGTLIMREYRAADILIIDDVQNIVGKQASIEFFFQLVDSFIREGKKVAFASDRAPKDLAMDERLTSRFSRGMLCLVSEPGFEMKYLILKRYYESVINNGAGPDNPNVDTSLLSMLPDREGHLTDEQLRHMAEISGNNIRNLESFCERCAGLAAEREAAGRELTAGDIDEAAKTYFNTAHKTIHIGTVQRVVEEFYHVSHEEMTGARRTANIAFARHVAVYLANSLCDMTTPAIGAEFGGRDHSTVLNSLKVVEKKMGADRRIREDVQNLKNAIMLRS